MTHHQHHNTTPAFVPSGRKRSCTMGWLILVVALELPYFGQPGTTPWLKKRNKVSSPCVCMPNAITGTIPFLTTLLSLREKARNTLVATVSKLKTNAAPTVLHLSRYDTRHEGAAAALIGALETNRNPATHCSTRPSNALHVFSLRPCRSGAHQLSPFHVWGSDPLIRE